MPKEHPFFEEVEIDGPIEEFEEEKETGQLEIFPLKKRPKTPTQVLFDRYENQN